MKILGMLAASWLCAAAPIAPHARVAVGPPAVAKPRATNVSKPAAQHPRVTASSVNVVHRRPIVRRRTVYWQNFCLHNPFDAACQDGNVAVEETAPRPAVPSVILNPYATTTQPPGPASLRAAPAVFSAPPQPIVKVSDELAARVSVGASQADVLHNLGEPHSRISGDIERYTYFLQSGGSLKLDFEDGHVTQMWKVAN
jgi:hypothetical protein